MASGITTPTLEYTKHILSYTNDIWMNDFLRLLQKYNMKLKMLKYYSPKSTFQ